MSPFADATARRRQLGQALRSLRNDALLTSVQLAGVLQVAQSTISRTETGRQLPSPELLDRWATATGASTQQRLDLDELAEAVATEAVAWRHRPRPLAALQQETADLEGSSGLVRGYHPILVPGLLQVPAYAAAVYRARAAVDGQDAAEVDEAVRERLAKQALLSREGHRFEFVLTEVGLRWRFVPPVVLAAQLQRLALVAWMPNVAIGVIPAALEVPVWGWQGFSAFLERAVSMEPAEDLVLVETLTAAVTVRSPADVASYDRAFQQLLDAALVDGDAVDLLERILVDLR
jgi:transcriptional regulator with XRE-family HTH domain